MSKEKETIVQAAIWYEDGFITLPRPYRHPDLLTELHAKGFGWMDQMEGFLTSKGWFVSRERAYQIAKEAGQIIKRPDVTETPGTLYTEDLW